MRMDQADTALPRVTADDVAAIPLAPMPRIGDPQELGDVVRLYRVQELPSYVDMGAPPVVTLTWSDRVQLRIEQTALTFAILRASLSILVAIDTISGYLTMNETPWYTQRRIWATVLGIIATVLSVFKVAVPDWLTTVAPDLLVQIATAVASAIAGILAAWSYVKPKPTEAPKG